jgi:hypothetical protein
MRGRKGKGVDIQGQATGGLSDHHSIVRHRSLLLCYKGKLKSILLITLDTLSNQHVHFMFVDAKKLDREIYQSSIQLLTPCPLIYTHRFSPELVL